MAMIHVGGRSYPLPADADTQVVASEVRAAVEAKGSLQVQVEVDGSPVTLYINTAQVDVIALDWNGTGAGFFHG
jgi:hypothetical protein